MSSCWSIPPTAWPVPIPACPRRAPRIEAQAAGVAADAVGGMTRLERVNSFLNHSGLLRDLSQSATMSAC